MLFVVEVISPAAQFLREAPQDSLSVLSGFRNDVGLNVIDNALYLALDFTGGVPKGFRYTLLTGHMSSIRMPGHQSEISSFQPKVSLAFGNPRR